ncbi:hypothetical protein L1987_10189 [Smallanthus sonchifolius]|uniref:Uncharacterized protein n=1 Tax=Smallanthus sonchifolius TaxID=185202 RepID=A0ACB9JRJ7_9ASTR|nr:hypothetical protein L1987_10189 [Smallanthus sonchifolius]
MEKNMMRMKDEYDDDQRQYLCISKYGKIINQFDELINMVDMVTKAPKRRRGSSSNSRSKRSVKVPDGGGKEKSCTSGIEGSTVSSTCGSDNRTGGGILVQIITNHLLGLNSTHHKA